MQRAHGEMAGAEVRARGAALQAARQERPHLHRRQRWARRRGGRVVRLGHQLVQDPLQLGPLPAVTPRGGGQRVGRLADGVRPVTQGLARVQRLHRLTHAGDQLREPAGELDRPAVDIVEREHSGEQPLAVLGHRHAQQQPVQPGPPGAALHLLQLVRGAVRSVQPPADPSLRDPASEPGDVVVVEPEAAADRAAVSQVQHLRGRQPLLGQVQQLRHDAQHRVGLAQRPVGQPNPEVDRCPGVGARRPAAVGSGPAAGGVVVHRRLPGAEGGLDQRRERLDVRAHDDHVPGLQRRVVRQRVEDRVTDDLHLARPAVAGVDLDAAVVCFQERPVLGRPGKRHARCAAVVPDVLLDPAEQRDGGRWRFVLMVDQGARGRGQHQLHLPGVTTPRGQQPVVGQPDCRIVGAAHDGTVRAVGHPAVGAAHDGTVRAVGHLAVGAAGHGGGEPVPREDLGPQRG